jgi:hypothetical protein
VQIPPLSQRTRRLKMKAVISDIVWSIRYERDRLKKAKAIFPNLSQKSLAANIKALNILFKNRHEDVTHASK